MVAPRPRPCGHVLIAFEGERWVDSLGAAAAIEQRGRTATFAGRRAVLVGCDDEPGGLENLAAEVRQVGRTSPDCLVDAAQIGQRERLGDELRREGGVLQLRSDPVEGMGENPRVVVREDRGVSAVGLTLQPCGALGVEVEVLDRPEAGLCRIGAGGRVGQVRGQRDVCDGGDVQAGADARIPVAFPCDQGSGAGLPPPDRALLRHGVYVAHPGSPAVGTVGLRRRDTACGWPRWR